MKICGVTNVQDAQNAADVGADAIGLNFYRQSARCVSVPMAESIVRAVGSRVSTVGVFVDTPVGDVAKIANQLALDLIQLHGDQPVEWLSQLNPRRVIRAIRLAPGDDNAVSDYWSAAQRLGVLPAAMLVDAFQIGQFGGTGKQANWDQVRRIGSLLGECPIVLAGGLHPENVVEAIRQSGCRAVDVASGVETAPGRKGLSEMKRFVSRAIAAFEA